MGLMLAMMLAGGDVVERAAKDTLTAVELDHGDTLRFALRDGRVVVLEVLDTAAPVLLTNLERPKNGFAGGQTLYEMTCRVRIDGHPMTMRRYVPVQESFYVPYVVNGLRIWFDGVKAADSFLTDNHGGGLPRKAARFAVQDATLPICPEELRPWYPNAANVLDVAESYEANDVWMGPYHGAELHGGLDVNQPSGTPLWAPMDVDTQFFFNSVKAGDNNNRWRGIRTWPDGGRWVIQAHHVNRLLVPERTPLKRGVHYAETAGEWAGRHAHSHFVFKIGPDEDEVRLDAWILFREIFETNRARAGEIRAAMAPLAPARTGEPVRFDASASRPGVTGNVLSHRWTFGDGGTSIDASPAHVFAEPGIYPVTLVVDDGTSRAAATQHLTVDGEPARPGLRLESDDLSFRPRPVDAMDVYGAPPGRPAHTLDFAARVKSSPKPPPKTVVVLNGDAPPAVSVAYREGAGWLSVEVEGDRLHVRVDALKRKPQRGIYRADVTVDCPGAPNSPQVFGVRLDVLPHAPPREAVVDDRDAEATPWFWLSPQYWRHGPKQWFPGHKGSYLVGRARDGERVRFTPDLAAGTYEVSFPDDVPFRPHHRAPDAVRFSVRVKHRDGLETLRVEPLVDRRIGTFPFSEGKDGYVEILSDGAEGPVVADAVRFRLQAAPPR